MQEIIVPYRPRKAFLPFHEREHRWSAMVCHRRAGKTVACINDLIKTAISFDKFADGRFAYVAPQYAQAKDIAWGYVKQYTGAIPGVQYNESELRVDFAHNGARVRLYGAENENRLRGLYFDGVILDEYALIHPSVYDLIIRPMLSDRRGWAVFMGTPNGHNAFYDKWKEALAKPDEYFSLMLKASETHILPADELEALRRDMTDDAYQQEYECNFEAAVKGAVFGKEMKEAEDSGRIIRVPYDPITEVWTAWDLGIADQTCIWFAQQVGREVRIIDFYHNAGMGIDHYVKVLKERPYNYARHILPHDAEKSELGSGSSVTEILRSLGVRNIRIARKVTVEEGIAKARLFLPKCVFDRGKCDYGIEALKLYRYMFDDKAKVQSKRPLHDWASHPSDAFRYLALGFAPEFMSSSKINYPRLAIP